MKNRCVVMFAIVLGFPLLGSARAETLNSKLADMVAAAAGKPEATSQEQQAVATAPVDEAQQQALEAEAQDNVNQALEKARDGQK